jgi:hypothetical protein
MRSMPLEKPHARHACALAAHAALRMGGSPLHAPPTLHAAKSPRARLDGRNLAHKPDIRTLVQQLGEDSADRARTDALATLATLCYQGDAADLHAITAAGAIPKLVKLLRPGSPAQQSAVSVVAHLAHNGSAAAGCLSQLVPAIPALVRMLGPGSQFDEVRADAAGALQDLAPHGGSAYIIAAAGAIPPLVQLLAVGSSADTQTQMHATGALYNLAVSAEHAASVIAAGAIPFLVRLRSGSPAQLNAAGAVMRLSVHAEHVVAIAAAGAIPPLLRPDRRRMDLLKYGELISQHTEMKEHVTAVQMRAAGALNNLALRADNAGAMIAVAGAVHLLVQLMRPSSSMPAQLFAARALNKLAANGMGVPHDSLLVAQRIAQSSDDTHGR